MLQLDGNPFEMATIVVAICGCPIRPSRRKLAHSSSPCWVFRDVIVDFLNGTVIVPFALLIGATFSSVLLAEALKSNKLFFAIAGLIGLLFALREYGNGD